MRGRFHCLASCRALDEVQRPLERIYSNRFEGISSGARAALWDCLWRTVLCRYVKSSDSVMDVGAGFCEFINAAACARRIAVDLGPVERFAAPGVEVLHASATNMAAIQARSLDVVFASNVFEHLESKDELFRALAEIYRVLRDGGRLMIIQPNIRFAFREYWDFVDHRLPLSDRSMVEALKASGFDIEESRPRFLPYTTVSGIPKWPWLFRLYLVLPPLHRLFGKQMFIVARKRQSEAAPCSGLA